MKRRTIAVFIAIALTVIYISLSWLTGKLIAYDIDNKIYQIDEFLNNHQKFIKFQSSYSDYRAGIFSTTLNLKVKVTPFSYFTHKITEDNQTILFNEKVTIYHGPFPWSEIKALRFFPKMAGIFYQMSKKRSPKLWAMANCQPYLSAKMSITYNQDVVLYLTSLPINKINLTETAIYNVSGGSLVLNTNKNFSKFDMSMNFDHLKIKDDKLNIHLSDLNVRGTSLPIKGNNLSYELSSSLSFASINRSDLRHNKESIKFNNINYHTVLNNNFNNGFSNTNKLNIDVIYLHDKHKNILIDDIKIVNENKSNNNSSVFGLVDYRVGKVLIGNQNFGFGCARISYENLPVSSLNLLANYFVEKKALPKQCEGIKLSLDKLYWRNAHGFMEMTLTALLKDITFDGTHSFAGIDKNNVDHIDFSLKIPFNTLTYFLAQTANTGSDEITSKHIHDAHKSTLLLSMLLKKSPSLQIILPQQSKQEKEPGIYANFHYNSNKEDAFINDEPVPISLFFKKLNLFN